MKNLQKEPSLIIAENDSQNLARIMGCKYASSLKGRYFTLQTWFEQKKVFVTVTLQNEDKTYVYPVEAYFEFEKEEGLSVKEVALTLVDYIDSYFDEYFQENEMSYLPIDWHPYSFEGCQFFLKGQIVNMHLESLANQLLGE